MEENKLSDEDIVTALECCIDSNCDECPYTKKNIDCSSGRQERDCIALIHRLGGATTISSWKNKFLNLVKENAYLKEENEALHKQNANVISFNDALYQEKAELQRQVDELKKERENMQDVIFALEEEKRELTKDRDFYRKFFDIANSNVL